MIQLNTDLIAHSFEVVHDSFGKDEKSRKYLQIKTTQDGSIQCSVTDVKSEGSPLSQINLVVKACLEKCNDTDHIRKILNGFKDITTELKDETLQGHFKNTLTDPLKEADQLLKEVEAKLSKGTEKFDEKSANSKLSSMEKDYPNFDVMMAAWNDTGVGVFGFDDKEGKYLFLWANPSDKKVEKLNGKAFQWFRGGDCTASSEDGKIRFKYNAEDMDPDKITEDNKPDTCYINGKEAPLL